MYQDGGNNTSNLYVFNGSAAATADVSVNFLDINGTNLVGVNIPGISPTETYPGETGVSTTPLLPKHTRNLTWTMPHASSDTDLAYTIQVTSNQPIVVGANLLGSGFMPNQCEELPK